MPQFATTRWSLVIAAGARETPEARQALEQLCTHYWTPLYAFVRHLGHAAEEARDIVQSFLLDLLERNALQVANPAQGRFRSFLLGCLKHFLSHHRERELTWKRGHGKMQFSLHTEEGEARYQPHCREAEPAVVFDRAWMSTVLQHVLDRLRRTMPEGERAYQERLLPGLYDPKCVNYQAVASEYGKTEEAVRQAVSRLRKKYRELLMEEIGNTVSSADEVEDEIRQLFQIAAG
jgi:RNA polymerase sigma-70 factor (ECF subfamily)